MEPDYVPAGPCQEFEVNLYDLDVFTSKMRFAENRITAFLYVDTKEPKIVKIRLRLKFTQTAIFTGTLREATCFLDGYQYGQAAIQTPKGKN